MVPCVLQKPLEEGSQNGFIRNERSLCQAVPLLARTWGDCKGLLDANSVVSHLDCPPLRAGEKILFCLPKICDESSPVFHFSVYFITLFM